MTSTKKNINNYDISENLVLNIIKALIKGTTNLEEYTNFVNGFDQKEMAKKQRI